MEDACNLTNEISLAANSATCLCTRNAAYPLINLYIIYSYRSMKFLQVLIFSDFADYPESAKISSRRKKTLAK